MIDFLSIKKQLHFHNEKMEDFILKNSPSRGHIIFERSVSLHNIFKTLKDFNEEVKDFSEIGETSFDSADNVKYEPLLNKKLLQINLTCLQKIDSLITNQHTIDLAELKRLVVSELETVENEVEEINKVLKETPEILSKNLRYIANKEAGHKPKVSVITCVKNLAGLVEETVRSISNQDYQDFEYIIIDGGSTDGTLDLIKKFPNIILVSENDSGYPDAFWKGLKLAKGDYILQCCVSDSFATTSWIRKCAEILDNNTDISLVYGLMCELTRDSKMVSISSPQFHYTEAPQKEDFFYYWLRSHRFQTEGNLCVRKSVLLKCYPSVEDCKKNILDWMEFGYRFNKLGYISYHLPIVGNYYHPNHENQFGKTLNKNGRWKKMSENYHRKVNIYKWKLVFKLAKHSFIDSEGNALNIKFDYYGILEEYLIRRIKKYLKPKSYVELTKKLLKIKSV